MNAIEDKIEDSKKLLDLRDDWDGEGASQIRYSTWKAATDFFRLLCTFDVKDKEILPARDGGIDIHLRCPLFELLVKFEPDGYVSYYGDDYQGDKIEGCTLPDVHFLSAWAYSLMRRCYREGVPPESLS